MVSVNFSIIYTLIIYILIIEIHIPGLSSLLDYKISLLLVDPAY